MLNRLLAALGLTLVFSAGFILMRDTIGKKSPYPQARPFTVPTPDGRQLGPQQYRGQVVLVNFWASYCIPCADEMPSLERAYRKYQPQGLAVLAVSIDDAMPQVTAFGQKYALSFPVALDASKAVAHSWGTQKVPETYVIARNGEVRARIMGAIDWDAPDVRRMLEDLLRERA